MGVTWTDALAVHRLLGAAHDAMRSSDGARARARAVLEEGATLPPEAQALGDALRAWLSDPELLSSVEEHHEPVLELFAAWLSSEGLPHMEDALGLTTETESDDLDDSVGGS